MGLDFFDLNLCLFELVAVALAGSCGNFLFCFEILDIEIFRKWCSRQ